MALDSDIIAEPTGVILQEKTTGGGTLSTPPATSDEETTRTYERDLNVTEDDLLEARELAGNYTLEEVRAKMMLVYQRHRRDPNFPIITISKIEEFLNNESILEDPEKHEHIIAEMRIETALITNNSPYAEVRALVDNHDDPNMPCSTIRAWFIGIFFCSVCVFVNTFFSIRQPSIGVGGEVPQLLAYPIGVFFAKVLPDAGFTLFGVRHSLNPGPFNKKEHMLITIIAGAAISAPYTNNIVWIQYLPKFYNQHWALDYGYQMSIALSSNFMGYGLAGIFRSVFIYPADCIWPSCLSTIALNAAFHTKTDRNPAVMGPFHRVWSISRVKFFNMVLVSMFFYFWFPNYLFTALSYFSWITWIAPNNANLTNITGFSSGLGLNPLPTFDWNILSTFTQPLVFPLFTTLNIFVGSFLSFFVVVAFYYGNACWTAYLPINSPQTFDRFGMPYNLTSVLNKHGVLDQEKYNLYSPPYISAGLTVNYFLSFASISAVLTYAALYYRREMLLAIKNLTRIFNSDSNDANDEIDVHNRLMKPYKEVPQWWYLLCLVGSLALGIVGIAHWPTGTSPAVMVFALIISLVFLVPSGIILSLTGVSLQVNVLAEFIGGAFTAGNGIALCFFKTFGLLAQVQTLVFSNDQKLAHYLKIPPRVTFCAQMVPTIFSTFIGVGVLYYQIHIKNVCSREAPDRFYCFGQDIYFTASVIWGAVGPKKLWGTGGQYVTTLVGFPLGVVLVLVYWAAAKRFPKSKLLRNTHPVILISGASNWAPFNLGYIWPAVPVAAFSWLYIRKRFLGLWSKYNYILSAALSAAIAISALVQFFALSYHPVTLSWWGNNVLGEGCDGLGGCVRKVLGDGESFGPRPGQF